MNIENQKLKVVAGKTKKGSMSAGIKHTLHTINDNPICTSTYLNTSIQQKEEITERLMLCWNACIGKTNKELKDSTP